MINESLTLTLQKLANFLGKNLVRVVGYVAGVVPEVFGDGVAAVGCVVCSNIRRIISRAIVRDVFYPVRRGVIQHGR